MQHDADDRCLSQSECNDWAGPYGCPLKAHARWVLNHRPPDDESRPQRIGSMGHAAFAEAVEAACSDRPAEPEAAIDREAHKRGWSTDGIADEFSLAMSAVYLLDESGLADVNPVNVVRLADGSPLVERRLHVSWRDVQRLSDLGDLRHCAAVLQRYRGIEGQVDSVVSRGADPWRIYDLKFRQSPDLGGSESDEESRLPDRQFAWYAVLLWAAGIRPAAGFECHQVNVYAGRWLGVDDFLMAARGEVPSWCETDAQADAYVSLVTSLGLPTLDMNRIGKVGAVRHEDWAEAHRHLTNARHDARLSEWNGKGKRPERLTSNQEAEARRFIEDLRHHQYVVARKFRADLSVCAEVVRDMIVSVEGPLSLSMRGVTPARVLQTYPRSQCMRPYGCSYQSPCHASLGSGRALQVLEEQKAQAMRLDADAPQMLSHAAQEVAHA